MHRSRSARASVAARPQGGRSHWQRRRRDIERSVDTKYQGRGHGRARGRCAEGRVAGQIALRTQERTELSGPALCARGGRDDRSRSGRWDPLPQTSCQHQGRISTITPTLLPARAIYGEARQWQKSLRGEAIVPWRAHIIAEGVTLEGMMSPKLSGWVHGLVRTVWPPCGGLSVKENEEAGACISVLHMPHQTRCKYVEVSMTRVHDNIKVARPGSRPAPECRPLARFATLFGPQS